MRAALLRMPRSGWEAYSGFRRQAWSSPRWSYYWRVLGQSARMRGGQRLCRPMRIKVIEPWTPTGWRGGSGLRLGEHPGKLTRDDGNRYRSGAGGGVGNAAAARDQIATQRNAA